MTRVSELRLWGTKYFHGKNVPDEDKVFFRRTCGSCDYLKGKIPEKYKYEVTAGVLHAYTSLTEAIRTKQKLEYPMRREHPAIGLFEVSKRYKIYKCFIPKETEYVTGLGSEIAAKALYVKETVNEESFIYRLLNWIVTDEYINS